MLYLVLGGPSTYPHFFLFFFVFAVQVGCFLFSCLPDCLSVHLHLLICCWFSIVCFSFQLLYSSALVLFYIFYLCWVLLHSSFNSIEHLYDHRFELFSRSLLIFILFSSFSEVLFFSLEHIPFSHFVLSLCVCFYASGETATFTSLEGVALCRNVPSVDCMCLMAFAG